MYPPSPKQSLECTLDVLAVAAEHKRVGQRCDGSVHHGSNHILILGVLGRRLEVDPDDGAIEKAYHGEVGPTGGDPTEVTSH